MMSSQPTHNQQGRGANKVRTKRRWRGKVSKLGLGVICLPIWLWCVGFAACLDDNIASGIAKLLALFILTGVPFAFFWFRKTHPVWPWAILAVVFTACLIGYASLQPANDRNWETAQAKLPSAEIKIDMATRAERVTVRNIRANRYGPQAQDRQSHYDDTYDLAKLESVWFGVDRFTDVEPVAHTFLSFEFEPGSHKTNYLAFSVETRREQDEQLYSPIRGLFKNYELIYVIADEQDVLSIRSDVRENVVQLYPMRATKEQARSMFLDMLGRVNSIRDRPEFYHTLTSNCTNNIVYHTNKILDQPISAWERGVVFPGYSDWLAYRLGIIDTEQSLDQAREKFRIDQRVKAFDGQGDFSEFIRNR